MVVYLVFYGPRKFFRSKWYWGLTIIAVVGLASAIVEIATAMYQSHDFTCGSLRVPGLPTFTPLILAQVSCHYRDGACTYLWGGMWEDCTGLCTTPAVFCSSLIHPAAPSLAHAHTHEHIHTHTRTHTHTHRLAASCACCLYMTHYMSSTSK